MFRYVQALRHFCSASTTHTPVAYHLCGAIEKGIARVIRIQETDRPVCLGDLGHNWGRDSVLDRRADPFLVAMTRYITYRRIMRRTDRNFAPADQAKGCCGKITWH